MLSMDLFMPPPHTCHLKPSALGTGGFFAPSIPLPCLICGQEARRQPWHQLATQPSSKALRLATADKGLRAHAKSQRGSGKGPRRGDTGSIPAIPWKTQACGSSAGTWVSLPNSVHLGSSSPLPLLGGGRRCWRMWWGHCIYCNTFQYLTAAEKAAGKPKKEKMNIIMNQ